MTQISEKQSPAGKGQTAATARKHNGAFGMSLYANTSFPPRVARELSILFRYGKATSFNKHSTSFPKR